MMCVARIRAMVCLAGTAVLLLAGCSQGRTELFAYGEPFREILDAQAAAWNCGDIDGFMEHYWQSEDLTFSSEGHTRRGWAETRARYERSYPTPERMGHLDFTDIEVHALGDNAALVLGRWHLMREPDPVGGSFSLVFRRIDGRWQIIHDHTSATAPD
jgi:beta-aspartyl-peptidase (threonine type)